MKKPIILIVCVIMLGCSLISCKHSLPEDEEMKIKKNTELFHANLVKECTDYKLITIKDLTPFEWDELHIFGTYYPINEIYKKIGVKWCGIRESLNEDTANMVFMKDKKIVCYYYEWSHNRRSYIFGDAYELELDAEDNPEFMVKSFQGSAVHLDWFNKNIVNIQGYGINSDMHGTWSSYENKKMDDYHLTTTFNFTISADGELLGLFLWDAYLENNVKVQGQGKLDVMGAIKGNTAYCTIIERSGDDVYNSLPIAEFTMEYDGKNFMLNMDFSSKIAPKLNDDTEILLDAMYTISRDSG